MTRILSLILISMTFMTIYSSTTLAKRVFIDDRIEYLNCLRQASRQFNIPYSLFHALAKQEAGWIGLRRPNRNKKGKISSYDLGLLQINTRWLKVFKPLHIDEYQLRYNGCISIFTAAIIFKYERDKHAKGNNWLAVANYHSKNKSLQWLYMNRVKKRYDKLIKLQRIAYAK